jgi:hypothetical protein
VIETNYVNYAVLYGCGLVNGKESSNGVWILGRNQTLPIEYVTKAIEALKRSKIVTKPFIVTNQSNCSFVPRSPIQKTDENDGS